MNWIYLSPHLDDVAYSCGGLVWEQCRAGDQVGIWTICAGDLPAGSLSPFAESLHARWETGENSMDRRRQEDRVACKLLGATPYHFSILDCIYRRASGSGMPLYPTEESLNGFLHPDDGDLVYQLSSTLFTTIPQHAEIVSPLTIGGHVDHVLTRSAADLLRKSIWYYADYPYLLKDTDLLTYLSKSGWDSTLFPVSAEGLQAWIKSIAAYTSQISTFWPDIATLGAELTAYYQIEGGIRLWRAP